MTIRQAFEETFGADQAAAIFAAAVEHGNGVNNANLGSDPFKWALLLAIGYQCMEVDHYRAHHNITAPWPELKQWIIMNADLGSHDGDCDYLCMMVGGYSEYVPNKEEVN